MSTNIKNAATGGVFSKGGESFEKLSDSDGLTQREAILTFAIEALIFGGDVIPKIANSSKTMIYDISKKGVLCSKELMVTREFKPLITYQYKGCQLNSGFWVDEIKLQNPIIKKTGTVKNDNYNRKKCIRLLTIWCQLRLNWLISL